MENNNEKLNFKISTGLKDIIGKDLISDKYIAIFELVKNSYDAGAELVTVSYLFNENKQPYFMICDDGCGMNYNDIINKWLFVAYSEKKPRNQIKSYIDSINREYAGAKGVGRFSCDRLGEKLKLFTHTETETETNVLTINWSDFEENDDKEFINIPVSYHQEKSLPNDLKKGTVLYIEELRENWSRDDLLKLKRSLMKLISPDFDKNKKPFNIEIKVPSEQKSDDRVKEDKTKNIYRDTVNGIIYNDIFEKLNLKTTSLKVDISEDGKTISSVLSDRGQYIFTLTEKNRHYPLLHDIHFRIYYLNQVAKAMFTNQMGKVTPKDYGSIFIYKNGFRINPYGNSGLDFFGIDQRKAQGWKRFLGTRELMGHISILGKNDEFTETSSRAHGFKETPSVKSLEEFFQKKVLTILEKYVVHLIKWGEPLKNQNNHVISPEEITNEIITKFFTSIAVDDVISIEYNQDVFLKNNTNNLSSTVDKLQKYAEKTDDEGFKKLAKTMKERTEFLMDQNSKLENDNIAKDREIDKLFKENELRKKQAFFLENASSQNVDNLLNMMHSMYTLADAVCGYLDDSIEIINSSLFSEELLENLFYVYESNQKIKKIADLAFNGNSIEKDSVTGDIANFISEYINKQHGYSLDIKIYADTPCICKFDPSSIGIIIDNIESNSKKNGADKIDITVSTQKQEITIAFTDNGLGLDPLIDVNMIFEKGITSNRSQKGFGFGLPTIKDLVTEMDGTVSIDKNFKNGFRLEIRLKNE